jgi:hypothetical protein
LLTLDGFGTDSLEGAGAAMLFSTLPAYEQTLDLGRCRRSVIASPTTSVHAAFVQACVDNDA